MAHDDLYFGSSDRRLHLYARSYPGEGPTILMQHGLTRNSSDFEGLAAHLQGRYRLIVPDQRGRGHSEWDSNAANYVPSNYCADMLSLIDLLGLDRPILIGTSMGGLMAMMMVALRPDGFRGIVLNDIGPEVERKGLDRLASYVGASESISNWDDAAAYCRRTNGFAFPQYSHAQWCIFARRLFREDKTGVPALAYDPAIASGLASANPSAVPPNLWAIWQGLATTPTLVMRGALSDILSRKTLCRMAELHPQMKSVTINDVGHAPFLDEPEAVEAIEAFLAGIC